MTHHHHRYSLLAGLLLVLSCGACSDTAGTGAGTGDECSPGEDVDCTCENGEASIAPCTSDGVAGECVCEEDSDAIGEDIAEETSSDALESDASDAPSDVQPEGDSSEQGDVDVAIGDGETGDAPSDAGEECVPGNLLVCDCFDGSTGTALCSDNGVIGECECTEPDIVEGGDVEDNPPDDPLLPAMYTMNGDCATPEDYIWPECLETVCAPGLACIGMGHCVPTGPFFLSDDPGAQQLKPMFSAIPGAGFAATWYDTETTITGQEMDVHYSVYSVDGSQLFPPVKVDQDAFPWARSPTIVTLNDGNFFIAWRSQFSNSGEIGFHARIMSATGEAITDAFALPVEPLVKGNASAGNIDSPFPKLLRNGNVAVAWAGEKTTGDDPNTEVQMRIYAPTGQPLTDVITPGEGYDGPDASPVVTDTKEGGVAVFWVRHLYELVEKDKPGSPGPVKQLSDRMIHGRFYDQTGAPQGESFLASHDGDEHECMSAAATFEDGTVFLTWKTQPSFSTTPAWTLGHKVGMEGPIPGAEVHAFGFDPLGNYPFYAPVAASGLGRAAIVWHTVDGTEDGVYMRRYYQAEDAIDCDITVVSPGPPSPANGYQRRLPAVMGFSDGRILVAYEGHFSGKTRTVLRYFK
jgi:hypothetical protein